MKRISILLLFFVSFSSFALVEVISKPEYVSYDAISVGMVFTDLSAANSFVHKNNISGSTSCYVRGASIKCSNGTINFSGTSCPEGTSLNTTTHYCEVDKSCDDIRWSNEYSINRDACFDIGGNFNFICDDTSGNAVYSMPCEQPSFCSSSTAQNQIADARNLCALDAGGATFTFTEGCSEQTRSINPTCNIDKCDSLACLDSDGDGVKNESDAFPDDPLEWDDSNGDGVGDNTGGDTAPTDPDCTLNCDPQPNCDLDPDSCLLPDMDLSDVVLRLDTMTNHQLTALESLQQDNKHLSKLNQRTDISNEMLDKINTGISILSDKSDLNVKKNQAVYDTLDTMRANDLKGTVKLTDALDRNSTSNNKLLRDLNTALGGLGEKLDDLKLEEPTPEPEDTGMGKVSLDPVDKTLINGLFSAEKTNELKDKAAALDQELTDGIDSNIKELKKSFTVSVSSTAQSDVGFNLSVAGMSIAVPNPLTTWSRYYGEIGVIIMLLASMSALVIVCSKN